MPGRALVIGGSIAGLFTGLFLRSIGWDVVIHERTGEELGGRGAGIVTHDELHEALAAATGGPGALGVEVRSRAVLAVDGAVVCEMERPQLLASWDRVWRRLRAAAGSLYRHRSTLVGVDQEASGVTARFADGGTVTADFLVGADGIQSTVRRLVMPGVEPRYAGYCAWRGLVDESALSAATRADLFDRFAFCLPPREQMLGYPVDGPGDDLRPGRRRYNYVWYRPAHPDHELPRLLTGADGQVYAGSIPPDRLHPAVVGAMRADAARLLAPPFAEVVRQTRQPLLQPIVDLAAPRLTAGRVALVGDAAFVARPHVGMGVTKAAGDARALAQALDAHDDIDAALAAFDTVRHAYGARIIRRARHLGAYLQAQRLSAAEREHAERHRRPEAVMAETATTAGMETW